MILILDTTQCSYQSYKLHKSCFYSKLVIKKIYSIKNKKPSKNYSMNTKNNINYNTKSPYFYKRGEQLAFFLQLKSYVNQYYRITYAIIRWFFCTTVTPLLIIRSTYFYPNSWLKT